MVVAIAAGGALVVVAVIGIIAALLIPNFIDALQRAKQKRTVADLRDWAVALESRAADQPLGAPPYPDAASIDELAAENAGAAKIGKVNIDENQQSAMNYGVEAIPTLIVFKGGQPVQRFQGIPAKARVQEALDSARG